MQSIFQHLSKNILVLRIIIATGILIVVFALGSVGYHFIEGISYFDGFYMTFITITTIGFKELTTLSVGGRILTMILFVLGIGVISYIASQTTQLIFESEIFKLRAMQKQLENMKQHYIVAGYGRIGKRIADVLRDANIPLVIIEHDEQKIKEIEREGFLYVKGDAQDEDNLKLVGIEMAKGLVATLSSDQDNIFVTLNARDLNADLFILSRTNEFQNRKKFLRAGANKVVSPYEIGGDRMANTILRPNVDQFIDNILGGPTQNYVFDEVTISKGSPLAGQTLEEADIRQKYPVIIIAISPAENNEIQFNPEGEDSLSEGDSLILLEDFEHIKDFREEVCKDFRSLEERVSNYDFVNRIANL